MVNKKISKGFSTDNGRYRYQLTAKKSPKKNLQSFLYKTCTKLRTQIQALKMIRRHILYRTHQGLKVLSHSVTELWATPYFRVDAQS